MLPAGAAVDRKPPFSCFGRRLSSWFPVNMIENLELNTRSNHPATGFNAQHTLTAVKISKSRLQDIPELSARSTTVRVRQDDPIGRGRLPLASPHS